jgi:hypothetical protein
VTKKELLVMNTSRRNLLLSTLFGAGCVGLRALATGIPASILLNPRRALANGCPPTAKPQYVIFCTSANGDPINANAPGSYGIPNVYNCPYPGMQPTMVQIGSQMYQAAAPWAAANLDPTRTQVWHIMTNTPVHPKEPDVLGLMSAISPAEMFPSFLAKNLAPCLKTIQSQPITVGASTPSEGLTYEGAALPIIPPIALKATLVSDPKSPLNTAGLEKLRDDTLTQLNNLYLQSATEAQKAFVTSYINSQTDLRAISTGLLQQLSDIPDNSPNSQVLAAVSLIRMSVSPVIAIHIPFGGDNHHDTMYATEGAQTISGMQTLASLLAQLKTAGLADSVSIVSLNVFGRTLLYDPKNGDGRQHNPNHQVSFVIGKPFKGGVIGGVTQLVKAGDFGALPISSMTGVGSTSGDIQPVDTLAAFGITVATGVGIDPMVVQQISAANNPAGMGSSKLVTAALA